MLKKELCIKCWANTGFQGWNECNERVWKRRERVICPILYTDFTDYGAGRKITELPPERCPFYLEQVI